MPSEYISGNATFWPPDTHNCPACPHPAIKSDVAVATDALTFSQDTVRREEDEVNSTSQMLQISDPVVGGAVSAVPASGFHSTPPFVAISDEYRLE